MLMKKQRNNWLLCENFQNRKTTSCSISITSLEYPFYPIPVLKLNISAPRQYNILTRTAEWCDIPVAGYKERSWCQWLLTVSMICDIITLARNGKDKNIRPSATNTRLKSEDKMYCMLFFFKKNSTYLHIYLIVHILYKIGGA